MGAHASNGPQSKLAAFVLASQAEAPTTVEAACDVCQVDAASQTRPLTCCDARILADNLREQRKRQDDRVSIPLSLMTEIYVMHMAYAFCKSRAKHPDDPSKWKWSTNCLEMQQQNAAEATGPPGPIDIILAGFVSLDGDDRRFYKNYLDFVIGRTTLIGRKLDSLCSDLGAVAHSRMEEMGGRVGQIEQGQEQFQDAIQAFVEHRMAELEERLENKQEAFQQAMASKMEQVLRENALLREEFNSFRDGTPQVLPRPTQIERATESWVEDSVILGFSCCLSNDGCHFPDDASGDADVRRPARRFKTVQGDWKKWVKYALLFTRTVEAVWAGATGNVREAAATLGAAFVEICQDWDQIAKDRLLESLDDRQIAGNSLLTSEDYNAMLKMLNESCFFESFTFCPGHHAWSCNWCASGAACPPALRTEKDVAVAGAEDGIPGMYHGSRGISWKKACNVRFINCTVPLLADAPPPSIWIMKIGKTEQQTRHVIPLRDILGLVTKPNKTLELVFWDPHGRHMSSIRNKTTGRNHWKRCGGSRVITFNGNDGAQAYKALVNGNLASLSASYLLAFSPPPPPPPPDSIADGIGREIELRGRGNRSSSRIHADGAKSTPPPEPPASKEEEKKEEAVG